MRIILSFLFMSVLLVEVARYLYSRAWSRRYVSTLYCGCGSSVKVVWARRVSKRAYWQRRFISSCVEWSQIAWPRGHRPARRRRRCRHRRRNRPMKLFHWKIRRRAPYHWSQPWRFVASSILTRGCLPSIFITVKYWHLSLMYATLPIFSKDSNYSHLLQFPRMFYTFTVVMSITVTVTILARRQLFMIWIWENFDT